MSADFPNTRLSVIERIRMGDDEDRKAALQAFIDAYRPALVAFLTKGHRISEADAEDCVHDFIINKIMNGKILESANGKGRFRNLLRVSLKRYLIDLLRRKNRDRIVEGLEVEEALADLDQSPDQFDCVWAIAVFSSALSMLKDNCPYWDLFVERVLTHPPVPYDEIVVRHNYDNPEKASNCLTTAKRQFNRYVELCLKEQSNWTEATDAESMTDEFEFLKGMLARPEVIQAALSGLNDGTLSITVSDDGHSIYGDHLILLEESTESLWENSEIPQIFDHLMCQPIGNFIESESADVQIAELLFQQKANNNYGPELKQLKEEFNKRGKSEKSSLPEKVDVTMTFAFVSAFITSGGNVGEITSMRVDFLARRIEQLTEKSWVSKSLSQLFRDAVDRLLS